jgi:hypothetical protein
MHVKKYILRGRIVVSLSTVLCRADEFGIVHCMPILDLDPHTNISQHVTSCSNFIGKYKP